MIIFFEGLSCCGKTTLIKKLQEVFAESIAIPELPVNFYERADLDDFCRRNDERKCLEARKYANNQLVFVDRGYASTLTYNFIQFQLGISQEYIDTLEWYMKGKINRVLLPPDCYVYLYVDKDLILERSKKLNRFAKNIAWYTDPEIGSRFYEGFFEIFEPDIPLLKIDGSLTLEIQVKQFINFINEKKFRISS